MKRFPYGKYYVYIYTLKTGEYMANIRIGYKDLHVIVDSDFDSALKRARDWIRAQGG